jgi:ABC-type sugar transport system ATPase subunit
MPPELPTTIELRNLSITAGTFSLRDVSLSVRAGEYVALMGRTGQGKTTILEAIAGLREISAGAIILEGRDVTQLPPAQRGVGYVPQDLALFPTMSVRANLAFALKIRGFSWQERMARVQDLAGWLGIASLLDRRVTSLSGGEAQRTALGRALSFQPQVLLLDEPFSALDDATREEMHQLMQRVREHTGVTVLHVTHNRAEAAALADRVLVIENGGLAAAGR